MHGLCSTASSWIPAFAGMTIERLEPCMRVGHGLKFKGVFETAGTQPHSGPKTEIFRKSIKFTYAQMIL